MHSYALLQRDAKIAKKILDASSSPTTVLNAKGEWSRTTLAISVLDNREDDCLKLMVDELNKDLPNVTPIKYLESNKLIMKQKKER